ncbi:MAG: two pore domain potassium channel family protein [Ardenticatenales bacterium]|nr:two pore domain potassium channel family protein [Ardenticatenales bacterium]
MDGPSQETIRSPDEPEQPERREVRQLKAERWVLLRQINAITDKPMIVLAFVWLLLLVLDLTGGLSPLLQALSYVIWALFVLDFGIEVLIAPDKSTYLRRNWLTAISLLLPALRVLRLARALRLLRAARAVRSVSLLRLVTSLNRGMRAVGQALGRDGVGFVMALTVIVTFAGAAGMYAFESPASLHTEGGAGAGLASYGEALWWTAMTMTTMGSDYFPVTVEGRILGWVLAVYAFAIFGYITATIASFLVGQKPSSRDQTDASELAALRAEVAALRTQLASLTATLQSNSASSNQHQGPPEAPKNMSSS